MEEVLEMTDVRWSVEPLCLLRYSQSAHRLGGNSCEPSAPRRSASESVRSDPALGT